MSDIKISQLPYIGKTGYTATDIIPFVNYINPTGTTSETKIDDLKDYILTGVVNGSGTTNYLPKWTGTTGLGDSQIQDDGTYVSISTSTAQYGLQVNNSISSTGGVGIRTYSDSGVGNQTGLFAYGVGNMTIGTSVGVYGGGIDGLIAIGVKGDVGVSEFGSVTTGIGGYFDGRGDGAYSYPSASYSVQLIDGTEGINKVLVSKTSDGKSNWSSDLIGLTSVSATTVSANTITTNTISATTYQNLPIDPNTYTTGYTYNENTFTIKQNNGQPDLTATINSVTGLTVNGDLTVTGNTSMKSVTATTVSASTLTLVSANVPPTPSVSTPFIDDYTRGTLSPGGTPSLTYTNTNTGTGNATIVTNYLNIVNGGTAGQSYTTVPLSGFGSPFNPTLSSNNSLSTIEWTFNLRTNRASIFAGFGASSYAGAVVLAGSNTNLQSTGSGYALVYGTTGTRNWKLVKYNNGLAGTQTDIITGGLFAGNTNYVSARIVYAPSTNTWSYYFRDDGASAWGDPTTTSTLIGSAVDSTYTSTLMSVFGVFFNYSTAASQNLQFDNLRVQQSVSPSATTIDQLTLKNNSGTEVFKVKDDGTTTIAGTVTSSIGFFGSFSGTHLGNGSSLTLGQSGIMVVGTSQLNLTSATTALTLIPGLSTTISVSGQTMVHIQTNGGVNTLATTSTGGSALDVAILVDGAVLASGGYQRMYADNPTANATVTNWVANWNTSVILTLAAGSHTIEVDAVYVAGSSASVSGGATTIKQGTLSVMVLKNN